MWNEPSQLTANKLIANQRFRYSNFVTHFVAVISPRSKDLGKMALGIVKIIFRIAVLSQSNVVRGQLVVVSCCGPMWEVALARISVLLLTSWYIIKSYTGSLIKLSRTNLFRLYFIEKDIIRGANGRKFERNDW